MKKIIRPSWKHHQAPELDMTEDVNMVSNAQANALQERVLSKPLAEIEDAAQ
ncbi:MAG: hypothetical protein QY328_00525 [Anaerolineales bacterium]|nr:hypothetical protein [Anaerolineales bacterium]WKZ40520.1 MAG: hypothetical protein QY328_00525 [Anaerolineales bacterium]